MSINARLNKIEQKMKEIGTDNALKMFFVEHNEDKTMFKVKYVNPDKGEATEVILTAEEYKEYESKNMRGDNLYIFCENLED